MNELEETLALKSQILNLVREHMGWDEAKTELWFHTINPLLGEVSPNNMLLIGRGEKVLKLVKALIDENTPPGGNPSACES